MAAPQGRVRQYVTRLVGLSGLTQERRAFILAALFGFEVSWPPFR